MPPLAVEVQTEDGTAVCVACCFRGRGELITYDNRAYLVTKSFATVWAADGLVSRGVTVVVPWKLRISPVEAALRWAAHAGAE